jgi:hypothetical protein
MAHAEVGLDRFIAICSSASDMMIEGSEMMTAVTTEFGRWPKEPSS